MSKLKDLLKDIENPAPSLFDPEIDNDDETVAKVTTGDDDNDHSEISELPSKSFGSLRSRTEDKLRDDPRYQGERVERSKLVGNSSELSDESDQEGDGLVPDEARKMFLKHFESMQNQDSESSEIEDQDEDVDDESNNIMESQNTDSNRKRVLVEDLRSDDEEEYQSGNGGSEEEDEEPGGTKLADIEKDVKQMSRNIQEQIVQNKEKGQAVKKQIDLWDKLLECRIRTQRALLKCNQLPLFDVLPAFKEYGGQEVNASLSETYSVLVELISKLLTLQDVLVLNNPSTKALFSGKEKPKDSAKTGDTESDIESDDEDIPSDIGEGGSDDESDKKPLSEEDSEIGSLDDEEHSSDDKIIKHRGLKRKQILSLDEYEVTIAKRFQTLATFRDAAIEKWHEKTRIASGKINTKSFSAFDRSPLVQIKQIMNDKERLIRRSQLQRNVYHILGSKMDSAASIDKQDPKDLADEHLKNYNPEIFDDDDFYHQLLKELIERKSNVSSDDPIAMGRQWLEMQKLRTKVKKKVDTKASKGRKVRYNIHAKLVSFMAPREACLLPQDNRAELFSSLFGKGVDLNADR